MSLNYLALHKKDFQSVAKQRQGGFGLIELMVSISIMTIVSSVILVRQSSFNGAVLLRNQTYDVALSAREVQLSAITTGNNQGEFRAILGLHFDTDSARNDRVIVFQDRAILPALPNGFYDVGDSIISEEVLDSRFEISALRDSLGVPITALSVIFVRPNFDANFFSAPGVPIPTESIEIEIASKDTAGLQRVLEITATGQIAVQ